MCKKLFLALLPVIFVTGCRGAINGVGFSVDAKELSTTTSTAAKTFSFKGHKFEYLGVINDGNGNFVFATENSYIKSVNGTPDALMRFNRTYSTGDILVYGLDNTSEMPTLIYSDHYSEKYDQNCYVIAGYDNFEIKYATKPGQIDFTPVNIGKLFFAC